MFRTIIAAGLLAATCLPAAAQEKLIWATTASDDGATLVFGAPETDNAMISFTCAKGNPLVLVSSMIGSKGLKVDEAAKVILAAGKVKKEFAGKAIANEESGAIDVNAGGKFDDIKAVTRGAPLLTIETQGVKQQISLTGAAEAYATFEKACKG